MNMEAILNEARSYVREQMTGEGTGHDWWHIHRVTKLAGKLAKQEEAKGYICELAALFHDLADEKLVADKQEAQRSIADWLEGHGVSEEDTAHIMDIISTMSFQGGGGAPMKTLEGEVVQDADRLDALGAIGIARTFVYAGSKGTVIFDPELPPREQMTREEYRTGNSTAVNHFYEKLLKLAALMNTAAGRRLALERQAFMEAFLEQFYREWELRDWR